jgi:hypothetical protein
MICRPCARGAPGRHRTDRRRVLDCPCRPRRERVLCRAPEGNAHPSRGAEAVNGRRRRATAESRHRPGTARKHSPSSPAARRAAGRAPASWLPTRCRRRGRRQRARGQPCRDLAHGGRVELDLRGRVGGGADRDDVVEPGGLQPAIQPLGGQIHEPGRDRDAEQHADQVRGPLGRHVPVGGQQHRRGVDPRPVADAARVRPGRGPGGVHLPAARAGQQRQQVLGDEPGDFHVPDLRPPRPCAIRVLQAGPAPGALRRRRDFLPLSGIGIPRQAGPPMTGLPAALTVLAPLPLRDLPLLLLPRPLGFAPLPRADRVLRRRYPRRGAVPPEPQVKVQAPKGCIWQT